MPKAESKIEPIAALIGREVLDWTPTHKRKVKWPDDYLESERRQIRAAARAVYDYMEMS